jgi:hypothetical protein
LREKHNKNTWQTTSLSSVFFGTRQTTSLLSVFSFALGKEIFFFHFLPFKIYFPHTTCGNPC